VGNLQSPTQIKNLLGYYPPDFFLQLKSSRTNAVHTHACESPFPVLDRDIFVPLYQTVLEKGLRAEPASALCLMPFALGKMALARREGSGMDPDSTNSGTPMATEELRGIDYFVPPYRIATGRMGLLL
jgi:hypothetical protein